MTDERPEEPENADQDGDTRGKKSNSTELTLAITMLILAIVTLITAF